MKPTMGGEGVRVSKDFKVGSVLYSVDYTVGEGKEYWEGITTISKIYDADNKIVVAIYMENGICFERYRIVESNRVNDVKVCVSGLLDEDVFFLNPREIEGIDSVKRLQKFIGYIKSFVEDAAIILTEYLNPLKDLKDLEEEEDEGEE